jgi:hypothetical protein
MTKNWKKFTSGKKLYFFGQKLQFRVLTLGLHEGRPSKLLVQEKYSSLKRDHLALKKFEFSSLSRIILALLDLDPYSQCGSGSCRPK